MALRLGGFVTAGGARLVLFPGCGGRVTTSRVRLVIFPGLGGIVATGGVRLILFPRGRSLGGRAATGGARLVLFPRCGGRVTTCSRARLILFPRLGGHAATGGARLILFPGYGGCVATSRVRLVLFPRCGGCSGSATTSRARLILFPRCGGLATTGGARLVLFPWCEQFVALARAFLGGVVLVRSCWLVCMRIRLVGCLFLGGSSRCYLVGTLAVRLLLVFPGASGCVECFRAAEFAGWFLGTVASADVGRLINDVFVSLV